MAGHIGHGDRHADRKLTIRPTEQLRVAALEALKERGLTANDYVIACLTALVADPDRQIANVAGHWPEPKPKGRPRKNPPTSPGAPHADVTPDDGGIPYSHLAN